MLNSTDKAQGFVLKCSDLEKEVQCQSQCSCQIHIFAVRAILVTQLTADLNFFNLKAHG